MSAQTTAVQRNNGPSAFGSDFHRFVNLTWVLAVSDFKLKFFGSVLGYVWSLMRPLLLFGVLYLVFTQVVRLGSEIEDYPVYLLTSIVLWTYFVEVTSGCVTCLVMRESLLRKIRFPRMVVPLSVALTALFNLGLNLIVVMIFVLISGIEPKLTWLLLPLLVLILLVLATGAGMLVSALYVRFRDVQPIWDVIIQMGFYISPILYAVTTLPANLQRPAMANPIAVVTSQMRRWLIQNDAPSAGQLIGGNVRLLLPLGIVAGVFVLGLWVFNREAPRIAENL